MSPFLRAVERATLEQHEAEILRSRGSELADSRCAYGEGGDGRARNGMAALRSAEVTRRQARIVALREAGADAREIRLATGLTLRQIAYAEKQARKAASSWTSVAR